MNDYTIVIHIKTVKDDLDYKKVVNFIIKVFYFLFQYNSINNCIC